jgi:hypothetical protein
MDWVTTPLELASTIAFRSVPVIDVGTPLHVAVAVPLNEYETGVLDATPVSVQYTNRSPLYDAVLPILLDTFVNVAPAAKAAVTARRLIPMIVDMRFFIRFPLLITLVYFKTKINCYISFKLSIICNCLSSNFITSLRVRGAGRAAVLYNCCTWTQRQNGRV